MPGGEFLIEALREMQISMDKYRTSEMGKALKRVFRGTMTVEESVMLAEEEIKAVFNRQESDMDTGFAFETIGTCPLCGGDVRKIKGLYGCSGYKNGCTFAVRTSICHRAISVSNLRLLLSEGRTEVIKGFVSKNGKSFDAALKLDPTGKAVFDFPERSTRRTASNEMTPVCPSCGGRIVKGKTAYGCANWREGCDFRIPFVREDGTVVTDEAVVEMLSAK